MKYISVQSATDYFIWQLEVFDYQFKKLGYDINDSIVMLLHDNKISPNVLKYIRKNKQRVILEIDDRLDKSYIPNAQIHGLDKLYKNHYDRIDDQNIFLHDSDIVFTKHFDWDSIVEEDRMMYCSDTVDYIGAKYIDSKSEELTERMCKVVGINSELIRYNQNDSGGAQYIFNKNLKVNFWEKVEQDGNNLYNLMDSTSAIYCPEHPIQKWTASMWSILWNFWLSGYRSIVHKDMNFSWGDYTTIDWDKNKIFHNAGILPDKIDLFNKGDYQNNMPFGEDFSYVKTNSCIYNYCKIIDNLSELNDFYK